MSSYGQTRPLKGQGRIVIPEEHETQTALQHLGFPYPAYETRQPMTNNRTEASTKA